MGFVLLMGFHLIKYLDKNWINYSSRIRKSNPESSWQMIGLWPPSEKSLPCSLYPWMRHIQRIRECQMIGLWPERERCLLVEGDDRERGF